MSQNLQGTTFNGKMNQKNDAEELVQDIKPTCNALSGMKDKNQNPQGQTVDEKQSLENLSLRYRISNLWAQFSALKKGMMIGGVTLFVIIVILFALLMVSLRSKPRFIIVGKERIPFPNSNQDLVRYKVRMERRKIFGNNNNSNIGITTVETNSTKGRVAQEVIDDQDLNLLYACVTFDEQKDGVRILATSPTDIEVQIDYQQLIKSSFQKDKRLLYQIEMRSALRRLQQDYFADPQTIIRDAQDSLKNAIAQVFPESKETVLLQEMQMVSIKQNNGHYELDNGDQKSSRLLYAIGDFRLMQQDEKEPLKIIFKQIADNALKSKLEQVKEVMNYITNHENIQQMDNQQLKQIVINSNLNDEVEINIQSAEPQEDRARLLQQDLNSDITTNEHQQRNLQTQQKSKAKQNNEEGKQKLNKKGKKKRNITVTQQGDCRKCVKKGNKTKCQKSVIYNIDSIFFVEGIFNSTEVKTTPLYSIKTKAKNLLKKLSKKKSEKVQQKQPKTKDKQSKTEKNNQAKNKGEKKKIEQSQNPSDSKKVNDKSKPNSPHDSSKGQKNKNANGNKDLKKQNKQNSKDQSNSKRQQSKPNQSSQKTENTPNSKQNQVKPKADQKQTSNNDPKQQKKQNSNQGSKSDQSTPNPQEQKISKKEEKVVPNNEGENNNAKKEAKEDSNGVSKKESPQGFQTVLKSQQVVVDNSP